MHYAYLIKFLSNLLKTNLFIKFYNLNLGM